MTTATIVNGNIIVLMRIGYAIPRAGAVANHVAQALILAMHFLMRNGMRTQSCNCLTPAAPLKQKSGVWLNPSQRRAVD